MELMAVSGGLKGLGTLLASEGIEDCRKSCGGNGFLLSSGYPHRLLCGVVPVPRSFLLSKTVGPFSADGRPVPFPTFLSRIIAGNQPQGGNNFRHCAVYVQSCSIGSWE